MARRRKRGTKGRLPEDPNRLYPVDIILLDHIMQPGITATEACRRSGVTPATYYRRRKRPVFQQAYRKRMDAYESAEEILQDVTMASRHARVEELERLYKEIADAAPDKVLTVEVRLRADGSIAGQGEDAVKVERRQIVYQKSNAGWKASILKDIKTEMEPIQRVHHTVSLTGLTDEDEQDVGARVKGFDKQFPAIEADWSERSDDDPEQGINGSEPEPEMT